MMSMREWVQKGIGYDQWVYDGQELERVRVICGLFYHGGSWHGRLFSTADLWVLLRELTMDSTCGGVASLGVVVWASDWGSQLEGPCTNRPRDWFGLSQSWQGPGVGWLMMVPILTNDLETKWLSWIERSSHEETAHFYWSLLINSTICNN